MGVHELLSLVMNSKSGRILDSLPPIGLEPATFGTQAHLSDRWAKSHLNSISIMLDNWAVSCFQSTNRILKEAKVLQSVRN
jgi:hypothetical protein